MKNIFKQFQSVQETLHTLIIAPPPRKTKRSAGFSEFYRLKSPFPVIANEVKQSKKMGKKHKSIRHPELDSGSHEMLNLVQHDTKITAFTLAEVLITLTIIGVIAALTVPNLLSKYQEQVTINKVKKFHSTINQALPQAIRAYGTPDTWDLVSSSPDSAQLIYNQLIKPYFKISKDCGTENIGKCEPDFYTALDGKRKIETNQRNYKCRLSDGISVAVGAENGTLPDGSNSYISFAIDTNGLNAPNTFGKDRFTFVATKDTIIATGLPNSVNFFDNDCKRKVLGNSCSAWVIYMGNMDYLRCPEKLSWYGKHSCKQ